MKKLIPVILCCAMLLAACGSPRKREHFRCRIFRGSFLCGKHHRRRGRRDRHRRERRSQHRKP